MTFEERTQLLNKMDHAKAYFNKKTDLYEQIIDIEKKKNDLALKIRYEQKYNVTPKIISFFAAIFLSPILGICLEYFLRLIHVLKEEYSFTLTMIFMAISGIVLFILFMLLGKKIKHLKLDKFENELKIYTKTMDIVVQSLNQYYLAYVDPGFISFKYTYPGMIDILKDYIEDHRADNIQDSINLYLDDVHKQRMEETQKKIQQAVSSTASSARSAKNWAAAGTIISVLGLLTRD